MPNKPIVFATRALPDDVAERLSASYIARANTEDTALSGEDIAAAATAHEADALIVTPPDPMNADTISRLPASVRAIACFSVGTNHVDLEAARKRGIAVTNTPDVLTEATAEIAMHLIVGAARRAWEGQSLLRTRQWDGWRPRQLVGLQLTGRRLGVLGMGRIGQALARRARAFGMSVHYHNRTRLPSEQEHGASYHETSDSLLEASDVLSIHVPATPETRGFLNASRIARLPGQAIVVNTARGDVVDDEALIAALRENRIFAAGLDVFAGEPNIHPGYYELPNAYLLPHMGSATVETRNAMGFRCLDNLDAFFAGDPPPDRVA